MKTEAVYRYFLECSSICTDTRKLKENCMFFALKGDNFNGNKYAASALKKGAKYCVVDEKIYAKSNNIFLVENVLTTLQDLAKYHRNQLGIPVIALTGSNGKTTTKELINAVLSTQYTTSATVGNLNNHIGVPLTLLNMNSSTEIGIIEMGANHLKEIEFLSNIAQPDYGLITNFGKAHLEGFGSLEGVIKGKSELYNYLKSNKKTIFINTTDATQLKQVENYKNIFKFGSNKLNDVQIELYKNLPYVSTKYNSKIIQSQLTGSYNFNNIAIAIAIGSYFKISDKNIAFAIENYIPTNNRSQIIKKKTNHIILDAYNANPTSMIAALNNFKQIDNTNKVLFLGDMFELGSESKTEHQYIVNYLETNFTENVFLIGKHFYDTTITKDHVTKFETFESLKTHLSAISFKNASILIKGSRGMALERILDLL